MRPSPRRPARTLAVHAVGACTLGIWAALLLTISCAPDLIEGPSGPPAAEAPLVAPAAGAVGRP